MSQIAILLIFSMLFWVFGVPMTVNRAHAAYMSQVSDELSDSAPNHPATHLIHFTTATSTFAGQTIQIQIDGKSQGTANLASTGGRQAQQAVFTMSGLAAGTHTISVVDQGPGPVAVDAIVAQ